MVAIAGDEGLKPANDLQVIENCLQCPFHLNELDPDPDDSFNRDDQSVHCTLTPNEDQDVNHKWVFMRNKYRAVSNGMRPFPKKMAKECIVPSWCPQGHYKAKAPESERIDAVNVTDSPVEAVSEPVTDKILAVHEEKKAQYQERMLNAFEKMKALDVTTKEGRSQLNENTSFINTMASYMSYVDNDIEDHLRRKKEKPYLYDV